MSRRLGRGRVGVAGALLAMSLSLVACGASPPSKPSGVLTGTLLRCTLHIQTERVQVYRDQDAKVVATERVVEGHTYRFVLPLGSYFISTGGPLTKAHPDVLEKAGQTVYQSFPPYGCF